MTARLLAAIPEGLATALSPGIATLVAVARAERAVVRLAYFPRIPSARLDLRGRVVVDTDREMARIERGTLDALGAIARTFDDVTVQTVVRFGAPGRELDLEIEAFRPSHVALFSPRSAGPLARWRVRSMHRRMSASPDVSVLVLETRTPAPVPAPLGPSAIAWWHDTGIVGPY